MVSGRTLLRFIGYGVSALGVVTGILMLAGWALGTAPASLRQTFGVVLICYGIYRFLLLRMSRTGPSDRWTREEPRTLKHDPEE